MSDLHQVDPYVFTVDCVERLWAEYVAHKKLVIAFDYDNTVFDYHENGWKFDRVISVLRRAKKQGFYLMLFTASEAERYPEAVEYLKTIGLEPDSINENPIPLPFGTERKPFFNLLLDDRAGLGQAVTVLEVVLDRVEAFEVKTKRQILIAHINASVAQLD